MKTIYSIIIAILVLFGATLFPNQAGAVVCQNKTAIVYSNGMFNDEWAADFSRQQLKIELEDKLVGTQLLTELEMTHLAYANDNGGFKTSFRTGLAQVLEAAWQALGDKGMRLFWEAVGGRSTQPVDPAVKQAMLDVALLYDKSVYINDKDFNSMMNGGNGFDGYRTLLSSGKRVLIVAHSQGNFYSNRVYREIADPVYGGNAALESSIGVVAVATPADISPGGKLGLNEPNITVTEDFVIGHVRTSFGSLPSKSNRASAFLNPFGWSSNVPEIGWLPLTTQLEKTTYGHNFVTWYLAGTYTHDFIMKGIVDTINGLGGYAGLQYPKKCIQWPPIQTPTSWQKILTHDWQTNRSGLIYSRRIRDDANEMMFNAQFNLQTGLVNIQATAFDDSVDTTLAPYRLLSYAPVMPLVCVNVWIPASSGSWLWGFVPVPGGVGALILSRGCVDNASAGGIDQDPFNMKLTLVSHIWNNASQTWGLSSSTIQFPQYTAYPPEGGAPMIISDYNCRQLRMIDTYKTSALCAGGWSYDASWRTTLNYMILNINNGVLSVTPSVIPYPWDFTGAPYQKIVPFPIGKYSGVQAIPLFSSYSSQEATAGGNVASLLTEPYLDAGDRVDQLIIGGTSSYIVGQGVKSAPGFYQYKLLAAWDGLRGSPGAYGIFNQYGVRHPTKMGVVSTIASTLDDILFFQWQ